MAELGYIDADWLRDRMTALGLSNERLAHKVGVHHHSMVSALLTGRRRVSLLDAPKLAEALQVSVHELLSRCGLDLDYRPPAPANDLPLGVPEIDVRAGAGDGAGEGLVDYEGGEPADAVAAVWQLPPDYLRSELRVRRDQARIVEVFGDSMSPTLVSGDRVMLNLADVKPSPPGIFAVWDGLGVVVKRLDYIPGSEPPTIKLISDNPHHAEYERTADEVRIIGRVMWVARRL